MIAEESHISEVEDNVQQRRLEAELSPECARSLPKETAKAPQYFATISRRNGFRRLHMSGACIGHFFESFAAMGDTPAEIRAAAQSDFALDPAASVEARANVAKLVSTWTLAKDLAANETKVLEAPRILQSSERQAMLTAVENLRPTVKVRDSSPMKISPSNLKRFRTQNQQRQHLMRSYPDKKNFLQASLDASGHSRVTKIKGKGKLPEQRKITGVP
eukprot:s1025_g10.t1